MTFSKGTWHRPRSISNEQMQANWDAIFTCEETNKQFDRVELALGSQGECARLLTGNESGSIPEAPARAESHESR